MGFSATFPPSASSTTTSSAKRIREVRKRGILIVATGVTTVAAGQSPDLLILYSVPSFSPYLLIISLFPSYHYLRHYFLYPLHSWHHPLSTHLPIRPPIFVPLASSPLSFSSSSSFGWYRDLLIHLFLRPFLLFPLTLPFLPFSLHIFLGFFGSKVLLLRFFKPPFPSLLSLFTASQYQLLGFVLNTI